MSEAQDETTAAAPAAADATPADATPAPEAFDPAAEEKPVGVRIEERLQAIEAHLGIGQGADTADTTATPAPAEGDSTTAAPAAETE